MMVYWKFAWREVRQRPSRAILTLLSIVIGVAAVVAVTIASGTTRRAFDQIYQTVAGRAALEISAPVGTSFDQSIVPKVRKLPGIEAVAPLVQRHTTMWVGKKLYRLIALGVDPADDQDVRDYDVTVGKSLRKGAHGVMLDETFAHNAGIKPPVQWHVYLPAVGGCIPMLVPVETVDSVDLLTRVGLVRAKVVAFYKSRGTSTTTEGSTLLMPLDAAQSLFKTYKKIDSAQIVLKPDADEPAVRAEIAKELPAGISVHPPAARSSLAEETSLSTEQGMRMARAFSLLVAVFIITNTFLINVTQRRKQLGIMRAIGATRAQIAGMVYREAILMGVVGTVIGSLLGVVAAHYLTAAMGTLYQASLPPIELTVYPFLIGTSCGLGISLLAAALPARKASHLSPLEAMRDVLQEEIEGSSRWLVASGAVLVILCICIMTASILGWLPMIHAVWAAILLLTGLVLLLPVALRPLTSVTAVVLRRLAPVEGRLARLQLLRHHSRTTLTVGVVFIAISTGIGLANSVMDNVADVRNWYRKAIVADFFVRATAPDMATGTSADLPDTVGPEINKIPGIISKDAMRFVNVHAAGENAIVIARDHSSPEPPDLDLVSGDLNTLRQRLRDGQVALGSVLAERAKLKVGDQITLDSDKGAKKFRIAAIVNDYQAGGLTIHMERNVARRELGIDGVDAYIIKADHNRLPEVRQALQEIVDRNGLILQSFSDIQHTIDVMMSGVVASLWAMVVLGLLVSAVGVTNTLTINVLEQTREIGLLRIVAMTRAQVRKTIFTQAMIMAILALVPGIIAGIAVAYLINLAMLPVTGHPVEFTLHPWLMSGGFVVGLLVVSLAAWFPADRASRLDLPTALRMA